MCTYRAAGNMPSWASGTYSVEALHVLGGIILLPGFQKFPIVFTYLPGAKQHSSFGVPPHRKTKNTP